MAVVFKNRVRKEIPDADLSKWEKDGWHPAGVEPVKSKPRAKVSAEAEIVLENDPEDSTLEKE